MLTPYSLWNGRPIGYEIQYKLKSESGNWTVLLYHFSTRIFFAYDLLKYKIYEFKVAARTRKGLGKFSSVVEERTMEDGKHGLMLFVDYFRLPNFGYYL